MRSRVSKDPFGAELRRFANNIDIHQFRPLSPGIGLGHVTRPELHDGLKTPYSQGFKNDPYAPPAVNSAPESAPVFDGHAQSLPLRRLFPTKELVIPQPPPHLTKMGEEPVRPTPRSAPARKPVGFFGRMLRKGFGHGVDLLAVIFSLMAALMVGGWFLTPKSGPFIPNLLQWTPVAELLHLSLIEVFAGIYCLYFLYWLFFRLVVGFTLGQGLIKSRHVAGHDDQLFVDEIPN